MVRPQNCKGVIIMLLEKYARQYEKQYRKLLRYINCTAVSFDLGNGLCCIVSPCAKQPGRYQCTFFDNKGPLSDIIRDRKEDIFRELILYDQTKLIDVIE